MLDVAHTTAVGAVARASITTTVPEVWLRLFNKNAPEPCPCRTREAVEIALCFGWIDSLARGHDEVSRIQRFSPRKPKSAWSKSNVERVQRLIEPGRMREPGQRQIDAAKADGRWPEPNRYADTRWAGTPCHRLNAWQNVEVSV